MYDTMLNVAYHLIYFEIYVSNYCPLLLEQFLYVKFELDSLIKDKLLRIYMIYPIFEWILIFVFY